MEWTYLAPYVCIAFGTAQNDFKSYLKVHHRCTYDRDNSHTNIQRFSPNIYLREEQNAVINCKCFVSIIVMVVDQNWKTSKEIATWTIWASLTWILASLLGWRHPSMLWSFTQEIWNNFQCQFGTRKKDSGHWRLWNSKGIFWCFTSHLKGQFKSLKSGRSFECLCKVCVSMVYCVLKIIHLNCRQKSTCVIIYFIEYCTLKK